MPAGNHDPLPVVHQRRTKLTKPITLASLAVALALLVAGCGSDDDSSSPAQASGGNSESSSTTATSLSKDEYIAHADELCHRVIIKAENEVLSYERKNDVIPFEIAGGKHASQISTTILIPAYQEQIDKLRAFGIPEEDGSTIEEMLDSMQRSVDEGKEGPAAFAETLAGGRNPFEEATGLANQFELKVCGRSTTEPIR